MADTEQQAYDPAQHGRDTPQSTFGPVVKTERHEDGQIYVITLNRPHRMNAIGDGLGEALYDAFAAFRDDPTARVAILTGAGDRAFCAGADLIATSETRQAQAESGAPTRSGPSSAPSWMPTRSCKRSTSPAPICARWRNWPRSRTAPCFPWPSVSAARD